MDKADLYRRMLRIRLVEEKIAELYPQGKMKCPTHLYTGQEAVAAGVCAALKEGDHVYGSHRSHGVYLAKGGSISRLFGELVGHPDGCSGGRGGSMHLADEGQGVMGTSAIVGGSIPIAVGDAWSAKLRGEDRVTAVFFGDSAVETGVFHESWNFAQLHRIPVMFICENNGMATATPREQRQGYSLTESLETERSCGWDAEDVYERTHRTMKLGWLPRLLVFDVHRWMSHVGPEKGADYGKDCPIEKLGYADMDIWNDIKDEIEEAVRRYHG